MRSLPLILIVPSLLASSTIAAETEWQPLYNRVDAGLQKQLEDRLNSNKRVAQAGPLQKVGRLRR